MRTNVGKIRKLKGSTNLTELRTLNRAETTELLLIQSLMNLDAQQQIGTLKLALQDAVVFLDRIERGQGQWTVAEVARIRQIGQLAGFAQ